jgi:chromate transport protein ChrA
VRCGEQAIVKAMSLMVYPFIVALLFLAVYLIPHWNGGILTTASQVPAPSALLHTLWLAIPVMVFRSTTRRSSRPLRWIRSVVTVSTLTSAARRSCVPTC